VSSQRDHVGKNVGAAASAELAVGRRARSNIGDDVAEALMPPGVRSLRSMMHATAVEVRGVGLCCIP